MNISNKRLLKVFSENSKSFYKNTENKDQKSKHWKTRYRIKKFSTENLINFRSSDLSLGLDDAAGQTDLLSSRVYNESFSDKNFYLYDDYKKNNYLSYEDFLTNDIIILPPNLNIDPKIKIDC